MKNEFEQVYNNGTGGNDRVPVYGFDKKCWSAHVLSVHSAIRRVMTMNQHWSHRADGDYCDRYLD